MNKNSFFFLVLFLLPLTNWLCKNDAAVDQTKLRNGVSYQEMLNPYSPSGLEGKLYEGSYDQFFTALQQEVSIAKSFPHATAIKFFQTGTVSLIKQTGQGFLRVDNQHNVTINIDQWQQHKNIKQIVRVSLMNEATNVVFFTANSAKIENKVNEEAISDFVMAMCPDEYTDAWLIFASGRVSPVLISGQGKLNDVQWGQRNGIQPLSYVTSMKLHSIAAMDAKGLTFQKMMAIQSQLQQTALINCANDSYCYGKTIAEGWGKQFNPNEAAKFKANCQREYKTLLNTMW